jgi:hypothetical protein
LEKDIGLCVKLTAFANREDETMFVKELVIFIISFVMTCAIFLAGGTLYWIISKIMKNL